MKTRIIWTKIWEDSWFSSLSNNGQKLFLYLITNFRINMCGCYEINDRIIISDTKIKSLELAKKELSPKVRFSNDWVYIVNAEGYGGYRGPKNVKVIEREISEIPLKIKDTLEYGKSYSVSIGYPESDQTLDTPINHKSEIINNNITNKVNNNIIKEKKIKEKKYSSITDITEDDLKDLSFELNIDYGIVKECLIRMNDWCRASGKHYLNYKSALRNWVKTDLERKGIKYGKPGISIMPTE